MLTFVGEVDRRKQLFEFAAQLIAITTDDRGTLSERMADHFPWMLALSDSDQQRCAKDLVNAARASFATEQPTLAIMELSSWYLEDLLVVSHGVAAVEALESDPAGCLLPVYPPGG